MSISAIIVLIFVGIILATAIIQMIMVIFFSQAPFVPTKKKVVKKIVKEIKLKPGQIFYDLGCGDAGLLYELSKIYPQAKLFGIERAFLPWMLGSIQNVLTGFKVRIKKKNIFKTDFRAADYIYCFLNSETMSKLAKKISKECKNNAIIISYVFSLPGFKPEKKLKVAKNEVVYFYRIKK